MFFILSQFSGSKSLVRLGANLLKDSKNSFLDAYKNMHEQLLEQERQGIVAPKVVLRFRSGITPDPGDTMRRRRVT